MRSEHAENNGKIFAWDDPPATGPPDEDFGCRCRAEPYYPDIEESFDLEFTNVSDTGPKWDSGTFALRYLLQSRRPVTLLQTGNLESVVQEYNRIVIDDISRLPKQNPEKMKFIPTNLFGIFLNLCNIWESPRYDIYDGDLSYWRTNTADLGALQQFLNPKW